MSQHIYKFLLSASLLMAFSSLWAQEEKEQEKPNQLTIDAQLMSRGEIRRGGMPGGTEDKDENKSNFVFNRTRLSVGYEREHLSVKMTAQHQGVWGAEGGGSISVYEAWAQLKSSNGLFARVGRQELVYDDERILGNNDWAMAALYHDALKGGYEHNGHKIHAIFAYNQNSNNVYGGTYYQNGAKPYKSMQTAWYHYDIPKQPLGVSLLFMNIGMQVGTPEDYHTIYQQLMGGYVTYRPGNLAVEAAYYHQTGKVSLDYTSDAGIPINAWMASAKATYRFNRQMTGYVGYDYLSGDKQFAVPKPGSIALTRHSEISAFTSLFGSTHKFYGAMDFFYVSSYYGTFSPGLQNLFAGVMYQPVKGLTCDASYHYLATATQLNEFSKTLGHEIEIKASYQLMRDVKLGMGLSFMGGTETMEALKRSTDKHQLQWGWLMLNVSPRVFTGKW